MPKEKLTGLIKTEKGIVTFIAEDFVFTFLPPYACLEKVPGDRIVIKPDSDGFIRRRTHDGDGIAIYLGGSVKLEDKRVLKISAYIVSETSLEDNPLTTFDEMEFIGGTLHSLYPPDVKFSEEHDTMELNSLKSGTVEKDRLETSEGKISSTKAHNVKMLILKYRDESIDIDINDSNLCAKIRMCFSSRNSCYYNEGYRIDGLHSVLRLSLRKRARIKKFEKIYAPILMLCQFLTFRENVGFDKVYLLSTEKDKKTHEVKFVKRALCYIRNNYKKLTNKEGCHCISIWSVQDSIPKLLKEFLTDRTNKQVYSVNFLPENDESWHYVSDSKIRNICSAIESELEKTKISPDNAANDSNAEELQQLINKVKNIVELHRDSVKHLDPKTYAVIFSSIRHWNQAFADRVLVLSRELKKEMNPIYKHFYRSLTKRSIDSFVKYRNNLTHGKFVTCSDRIAETAFLLMCLVYCSVLSRCGVSKDH